MRAASRKRSFVSIGLAVGLLAVLWIAFSYRRELQLEWCRRKASQDCLQPGFDRKFPTPAWRELLGAGGRGFPHLAKLLRDPQFEVWKMAVDLADHEMAEEPRERFVEYLRQRDLCASILYHIAPCDPRDPDSDKATIWRGGGDQFGRGYWSGNPEKAIAAAPEAIAFLKEVLAETPQTGEGPGDYCEFKRR